MNHQVDVRQKPWAQEASFWIFSTLLFLIIFASNQRIMGWLNLSPSFWNFGSRIGTISELIAPLRGVFFLLALAALVRPVIQDLRKPDQQLVRPSAWTAIFAFSILVLLIVPQGLRGLGQEYGSQSINLFDRPTSAASYQRFLMPALGYVTFLRGAVFFFLFSLICTFGLIHLTHLWFVKNGVRLPFWGLLSVLTSSFIAAEYQIPGYPDVLIYIFLLLIVIYPLRDISKLSLIVLSLSAHEATIILYGLFAIFILNKRTLAKLYGIFIIYVLLWVGSEGFNLIALINNRPQPSATVNMTSLEWVSNNPGREILGIFIAYKLLWILIVWALVVLWRKRDLWLMFQIIVILASSMTMTLLAIDTSRLMGWSFYALFLSIKVIYEDNKPLIRNITNAIFFMNLIVPSAYVGLNVGMTLPAGLYSLLRTLKNWALSVSAR